MASLRFCPASCRPHGDSLLADTQMETLPVPLKHQFAVGNDGKTAFGYWSLYSSSSKNQSCSISTDPSSLHSESSKNNLYIVIEVSKSYFNKYLGILKNLDSLVFSKVYNINNLIKSPKPTPKNTLMISKCNAAHMLTCLKLQ